MMITLKLKSVIIFGLIAFVILLALMPQPGDAAQYYRVNVHASFDITAWSICQNVKNEGSADIFVPTNSSAEWAAFRNHLPAGVTLGTCFTCGQTVTDVDNNTYSTVLIGAQCWMGENMRTTKYPSGGSITKGPAGLDSSWGTDNQYYSCPPNTNNNGEDCDAAGGVAKLGMLYQWSAVMNGVTSEGAQGICPTGWHIPTDAEFKTLVEGQATAGCESWAGWQCSPAGTALKSGILGFNGLLAGFRRTDGSYYNRGTMANVWSSTPPAWIRQLRVADGLVGRYNYPGMWGMSARCLKN